MTIKEQLIGFLDATQEARSLINSYADKKRNLTTPLFHRVETFLNLTEHETFNIREDEVRGISIYSRDTAEDDGALITIYNHTYGEYYNEEDIFVPWEIIEMTDEEFKDWVQDKEETKRILEEAKNQVDEEYQRAERLKQYEKLKAEFEP